MAQGTFDRVDAWARLGTTAFDVVVIGGGLAGCGVAVDAAARGLRTALVERDDFAAGASSCSSHLVHGGLYDLWDDEVRLAGRVLSERERLRHNAPHLADDVPLVLPALAPRGTADRGNGRLLGSLLWAHDALGGWRAGHGHRRLDTAEVLALVPGLDPGRLTGGFLCHDTRIDDARLTMALARTAAIDLGAVAVNRARAEGVVRDASGALIGVRVRPARPRRATTEGPPPTAVGSPAGDVLTVRTRWLVDASDVDVGGATAPAEQGTSGTRPALMTKGVHLTVSRDSLPVTAAVVVPGAGGRPVVVAPWGTHTYIGTATTADSPPPGEVRCTAADVARLLDVVNRTFATVVGAPAVSGAWASLRSTVAGPAGGSHDRIGGTGGGHGTQRVGVEHGMVTVTGGEMATYRMLAARAVDALVAGLDERTRLRVRRRCPTRRLPLRGAATWADVRDGVDLSRRWSDEVRHHLAGRYGGEARTLLAMLERRPELAHPLVEGLPYLRAEAVYGAREEMANDLADVLDRRTRARLLDREATAAAVPSCADLIAPVLGWGRARRDAEIGAYLADLDADRRALAATPATATT